jgi:drug/metabolite transporter (DMT)-like permease
MIAISGVISTFVILGLLQTKFFTTQIIGSLGFVSSSLCAAFFLGEELHAGKIVALCVAVVGVVIFSWKGSEHKLALDRGMIFTILAVLLSGFASILYKLATFHVPDYGSRTSWPSCTIFAI